MCTGVLCKSWKDTALSSSRCWKGLSLCERWVHRHYGSASRGGCTRGDLWCLRALCLHLTPTAVRISFAWFLEMAGHILLVLPGPIEMQNIMDSLCFPGSTHRCATEKQYLRDGTVSFLLNQVTFTQHVCPPSVPETHSCTRWICHQSSPRRALLYFSVHGTSDYFFM